VSQSFRASPLALTVLSLLHTAPLHPYGLQRLIKAWGKDQVVNVSQRANLYKTIGRLTEAGLIAVRNTERDQQYPERTVYEITDAGREICHRWLVDMLSAPRNEFPEFPAALSSIMLLDPPEALAVLQKRAAAINETVARLKADLKSAGTSLPRVTVLETEFQLAVSKAELSWLTAVVADLANKSLTWADDLAEQAKTYLTD
jgi:DNA-binding PadR family transcriptional regulator